MVRKYIIFLSFISIAYAQISMSDINKLSNSQLDLIRQELSSKPALSDTASDIDIDKPSPATINIQSPSPSASSYFGYNYLKRTINFFDNIPTPPDFKLGPGDEIILSLWGETNSRENFLINKEGLIYYENIGFINLSNKNLKEAEAVLVEELSRIYSTLKDKENQTKLMLELGKIKSINVYFSGQIERPGINLIHPFSDVFSAIVQAGGVKQEGSLRQVQVIRNNKVISTIDFYSFFIDGKNNFSSTRILDGDVIHIPIVSKRAQIKGAISNPGFFELLDGESLADLIGYAGNLEANAASTITLDRLVPLSERLSDDNARVSIVTNVATASNTKLNDGDIVDVRGIDDVITKVQILGRVKSPGSYSSTLTLKEVLDLAGGFNDPIFRESIRDDEIVVIRKDANQFYGLEFKIPYSESNAFNLMPGDKIFVYEDSFYTNLFTVSVIGAVNKRGSFQLKSGMTIQDAIDLAEGFSPIANEEAITVTETFSSVDDDGNMLEQRNTVNDATLDFEPTNGSVINVLPLENVVNVEGNVYNPGLVTYKKAKTVNKYINLAGGPKPNTLSTKIYVKRANGRIKKVTFFQGIGTIVKPGDTIFVPVDPDPQEFDITAFISDIATTLANIAAILVIIDNQND